MNVEKFSGGWKIVEELVVNKNFLYILCERLPYKFSDFFSRCFFHSFVEKKLLGGIKGFSWGKVVMKVEWFGQLMPKKSLA